MMKVVKEVQKAREKRGTRTMMVERLAIEIGWSQLRSHTHPATTLPAKNIELIWKLRGSVLGTVVDLLLNKHQLLI